MVKPSMIAATSINEYGSGVATIHDRPSFNVAVFHRSTPSNPRAQGPRSQFAGGQGSGAERGFASRFRSGDGCGIPGRIDGDAGLSVILLRATAGNRERPAGPFSRGHGISTPQRSPRTPDTRGTRCLWRSRRSRCSRPRNVAGSLATSRWFARHGGRTIAGRPPTAA